MSKQSIFSTRVMVVLVSIITLVLVVGSAILQRIVFKADEPTANIYFSQSTIAVQPGAAFDLDLLVDFSAKTVLTGAEFTFDFDTTLLSVTGTDEAVGWQTIARRTDAAGRYAWVILPDQQSSLVFESSSRTRIATVHLKALEAGAANLKFDPNATILAASSPTNPTVIDNALASIQDSRVVVSEDSKSADESAAQPVRVLADTADTSLSFDSQRIIDVKVLPTTDSATVLVSLQYPARVTVMFGLTTELTNSATGSSASDAAVIKLSGLKSNTLYYYQVIAAKVDSTDQIKSQLKSFSTPIVSDSSATHAQLTVFPERAKSTSVVYALLYDESNRIVADASPSITIKNDQISASNLTSVGGLYQSRLASSTARRQSTRLNLELEGLTLASASALFDPALQPHLSADKTFPHLAGDQKTTSTILIMVLALLLSGLGFYKLARIK